MYEKTYKNTKTAKNLSGINILLIKPRLEIICLTSFSGLPFIRTWAGIFLRANSRDSSLALCQPASHKITCFLDIRDFIFCFDYPGRVSKKIFIGWDIA